MLGLRDRASKPPQVNVPDLQSAKVALKRMLSGPGVNYTLIGAGSSPNGPFRFTSVNQMGLASSSFDNCNLTYRLSMRMQQELGGEGRLEIEKEFVVPLVDLDLSSIKKEVQRSAFPGMPNLWNINMFTRDSKPSISDTLLRNINTIFPPTTRAPFGDQAQIP